MVDAVVAAVVAAVAAAPVAPAAPAVAAVVAPAVRVCAGAVEKGGAMGAAVVAAATSSRAKDRTSWKTWSRSTASRRS